MAQLSESEAETWIPATQSEKAEAWRQLERLVQDPLFSHSKRYPIFLECVVRHLLLGTSEGVKERLLGIEVFGRPADYDTNTDPIVRVTATEIRKRLALYYQAPAHRDQICFLLPLGSYIPHLYRSADQAPLGRTGIDHEILDPTARDKGSENSSGPTLPRGWLRRNRIIPLAVAVVLVALTGAAVVLARLPHPSAADVFWSPMLRSSTPVLVCVAEQNQAPATFFPNGAGSSRVPVRVTLPHTLVMDDTVPLLAVAAMMQAHNHSYRVKGQSITTLADLSQAPDVLIGAFDNHWTLRFTQPLRYRFAMDHKTGEQWIEDRVNPAAAKWGRTLAQIKADTPYTDYAIVARYFDPDTAKVVVIAAGLGHGGTAAAGRFLSNSSEIRSLIRRAPPGWKRLNLEAVLKTTVMGGQSGAPEIVTAYFW